MTVMGVDTFCEPYVADTWATPPMRPDGVKTPVAAATRPICPRSMENDAGTSTPPTYALNVTVGAWVPCGTAIDVLTGVMVSMPVRPSLSVASPSRLGASERPLGPSSPIDPSGWPPPVNPELLFELPHAPATAAMHRTSSSTNPKRDTREWGIGTRQLTTLAGLAHSSVPTGRRRVGRRATW